MSHCYFPVAFLTQAPVPFLHVADFKGVRRGWDLRGTHGYYVQVESAHLVTKTKPDSGSAPGPAILMPREVKMIRGFFGCHQFSQWL